MEYTPSSRPSPRGWETGFQGQTEVRLRRPAHLGFHQLLFDALGGIFPIVQLLQFPLGSLFCLADILQELSGLCASFYGLAGERGQNTGVYVHLCGRQKRQKTEKAGDANHIGSTFQARVHLLHILCMAGTRFFKLTEFGTGLIVTNDALPFLGVSKKSFVSPT